CAGTPPPSVRQLTPSVKSSNSSIARPSWLGSFGGVASSTCWASRCGRTRRVTSRRRGWTEARDEIAEAQLLEVFHLAAHPSLMHGFIERNQRGLEDLPHALPRQQFRK